MSLFNSDLKGLVSSTSSLLRGDFSLHLSVNMSKLRN